MYIVAVSFDIKPEHVKDFDQAIRLQSDNSLNKESECHQFDVCRDPDDKTKIFLYEVYTNVEAFEAHRNTKHFANFSETTKDWIADKSVHCYEKIHP